jgi:signal transduction histidine kinase
LRLETRTTLNYIIVSAIIYVIVAVSFFFSVQYVIYKEVDRRLLVEKSDFEQYIDRIGYWEENSYFVEDKINVSPTLRTSPIEFKDTLMISRYDDAEYVPFRQVSFDKKIADTLYRVSIRKSLIESNQLLKVITIVMLVVLSGGLSLLYVFQQRTSKRLWRPFYETLSKAKEFNVHQGDKLVLSPQKIHEFNELNSALNKMTDKILRDYQSLREFTENASHEIQTPLALINTRVEGLIQDNAMSATHMRWIQDIHESVMRLSKLNHALLTLAKIENEQFHDTEILDLNDIVKKHVERMEEVFSLKGINLKVNDRGSFTTQINHSLADMLVGNLLTNAVKHNLPQDGTITIEMSADELRFSNSGHPLTIDPRKLFERFQRQNRSASSLGLGLAIVKKICETCELGLDYQYSDGVHAIVITKPA